MDEKTRKEFEDRVVLDSLSLKCDACNKSTAVLTLLVDGKKKGNFCSPCAGVRSNIEVESLIRAAEAAKSVIEPVVEEVKVEEPPKAKKEKDSK